MNFESKLKELERLVASAERIKKYVEDAAQNTAKILDACDALGVKRIGVGMRDQSFKDSAGHPFGASGSIFADGRGKEVYLNQDGTRTEREGWPIAWGIARKSGLSGGAGNTGQHQISGPVIDGIYECKSGEWRKVDD